jgi:hypothetical protein
LHSGGSRQWLARRGEFAFDFRFVIDQELNGLDILVFRHLDGEFRISYSCDFS